MAEEVSLTGYRTIFGGSKARGTCILLDSKRTHVIHDLKIPLSSLEYVMIEVIPNRVNKKNVFILNVYSAPRNRVQRFKLLLQKASKLAGDHPLIVAGDFNAPYQVWGYKHDTVKGKDLWQNAAEFDITLVTDPAFPTRIGMSTCRDTTPDLCVVKNAAKPSWYNLAEDLGSDHYINQVVFEVEGRRPKALTFIDWDKFRMIREETGERGKEFEGLYRPSLEDWVTQVREDVKEATKEITTDLEVDSVDSRLAHLIEAKRSMQARWKGQRLNRRLRKKISELNKLIEEHCKLLSRQQWDEVCNSVDEQVRNGRSWGLLKHLLNDSNTMVSQGHVLARAAHEAVGSASEEELVEKLANKYLPVADPDVFLTEQAYTGEDFSLDEDFSVEEVRTVLHNLKSKSAPRVDGISNKLLKNLDDRSIKYLTGEVNAMWRDGVVPVQWKTALTVLIPKAGKVPSIDTLRPISLTSCVDKVAEHAVLNRLTRYLEENQVYPHTMIGFRAGLSTQDAMKLIKHHHQVMEMEGALRPF
ncbi:uncharacterized protein LOC142557943 [Dermacentor variabilis]|uniref:uncharacterized protein LOC142557943 n=1 Tax=Dermacentor variabilis TaxID=34621 RepID=UPI003F5BB95E